MWTRNVPKNFNVGPHWDHLSFFTENVFCDVALRDMVNKDFPFRISYARKSDFGDGTGVHWQCAKRIGRKYLDVFNPADYHWEASPLCVLYSLYDQLHARFGLPRLTKVPGTSHQVYVHNLELVSIMLKKLTTNVWFKEIYTKFYVAYEVRYTYQEWRALAVEHLHRFFESFE